MSFKHDVINDIIRVEGGYVNNPNDSGGETNFGITKSVARSFGYDGRMSDMPRDIAFDIYSAQYWDTVKGDDLTSLEPKIAEEVVDTCVNMGVNRAGTFLQRALNSLNNRETLYQDVIVDGHIGNATLTALSLMIDKRDTNTLIKMLNCLQGAFYVELAERREKDEVFINGWFKKRVKI